MNTRLLGTIALITSPLMFVSGMLFDMANRDPRAEVLGLFFVIGWMCSLAALWQLKATGRGVGGKVVLIIAAFGLVLALGNQLYGITRAGDEANLLFIITDIAWPASVTYMLVVGTATIRAGVLPGWRRFAPLLCGFAFLGIVVSGMIGGAAAINIFFPAYTFITWGLMAYAIRTADQPAAATLVPATR